MNKKLITLTIGLACGVACISSAATPNPKAPNFLVVLVDDMGWGDLGCYGHPVIQSPNLDAFAAEGVRFTDFHSAASSCSPSRAGIITGRTPYRTGVFRWIPEYHEAHLQDHEITIAEVLREQGYTTCHIGKWHLNSYFNRPEQPQIDDQGFDYWFATQNVARPDHQNPTNFVRNGTACGEIEGFSALICADEAVNWLKTERDPEKPFYLQIWNHEPHKPIKSAPEYKALYPDETPGRQEYFGNITQIDVGFGKLMEGLRELGLEENTLVIFTSDNGPEGKVRDLDSPKKVTHGSTGGFRGRKREQWEGGIRVSCLARWPGRITPGTVSDIPAIGTDLFTTFCTIAGAPVPSHAPIDGVNILPAFNGNSVDRNRPMYWRTSEAKKDCKVAIRLNDWKLCADEAMEKFQLFNLKTDPYETTDVKAAHPEQYKKLKKQMLELDAEVMNEAPKWVHRPQDGYWKKGPQKTSKK